MPDLVWDNIQAGISETAVRRPTLIGWKRKAASLAAALLLGAFATFAFIKSSSTTPHYATVVYASDGSSVTAGTGIATLSTAHYVELEVPGTGLLRVHPSSSLEFTDRHTVVLHRGQLFAEIDQGPFTIQTPHGPVSVIGTKFGVRCGDDTTAVYTVEGTVTFGPDQPVGAGQILTVGADGSSVSAGAFEQLGWVAHRLGDPSLTLDASFQKNTLRIEIQNHGLAPARLHDLGDWSQFLSLVAHPQQGEPFPLDLTAAGAPEVAAYRRIDRDIQIDLLHPLTIEINLRPLLKPGSYVVRTTFSANSVDAETWDGMIEAPKPLRLEVTADE